MLCKGAEVQWAVRVAWGRDLGLEQGPGPGASRPCRFHWLREALASLVFPILKTCLCAPRGEIESREEVDQKPPLAEIIRKKKKSQ